MRIAITGATGLVGRAFARVARPDHDVVAFPHTPSREFPKAAAVDVTDAPAVRKAIAAAQPDWVVHAAATTDVDACEREPKAARRVNADGAENVANAAAAAGARLVYLSTDYVFDGRKGQYTEEDTPAPINAYGRSKHAGEQAVRKVLPDAVVARPSVVFGPDGPNFVSWLTQTLARGKPVRAANDQRVSPTYAADLSHQVLALMHADGEGVFHTAGADAMTRLDMAQTVARVFGFDDSLITPVPMADLDWKAPRPKDTSLDVTKVSRHAEPMRFTEALRAMAEVSTA